MRPKVKAALESVIVLAVTLAAIGAFTRTPLAAWERQVLQRNYIEYALMIALPLLILALTRRSPAAFGISLANAGYHVDIALTCFIPYAVSQAIGYGASLREPWGSLRDAVLALVVLVVCAFLLRHKPAPGAVAGVGMLAFGVAAAGPNWGNAASALAFYTLFLGPGEEILFRGYIQSRLNQAFGRSFRFLGVPWGWGAIITALLFSLFHVLNLPRLYAGAVDLLWWRGLSAFCTGLIFGYLRERTGSVLAPALLHGVPQAVAWAYLGL